MASRKPPPFLSIPPPPRPPRLQTAPSIRRRPQRRRRLSRRRLRRRRPTPPSRTDAARGKMPFAPPRGLAAGRVWLASEQAFHDGARLGEVHLTGIGVFQRRHDLAHILDARRAGLRDR